MSDFAQNQTFVTIQPTNDTYDTFIVVMNYIEFPICICGFLNNVLLLYMLHYRSPFTPNVRLLLKTTAISHCIVILSMAIKSILVIISYYFSFSIALSKPSCFATSGISAFVPMEISAFSIWLILFERLYVSLKFKENAEISKRLLCSTLTFAIFIAFVILLITYFIADEKPRNPVMYCNVLFYGNLSFIYLFLFYFTGEAFVLISFIWIKHNSLKYIEAFRVNCAQSKLEMRFQLKKNIEVTKAVLPMLLLQSTLGVIGTIIAMYFCLQFPGYAAIILSMEILCYVVIPIYILLAPVLLMWNERKLRPNLKIGNIENVGNAMNNIAAQTPDEGELRLQALSGMWNHQYTRRLSAIR